MPGSKRRKFDLRTQERLREILRLVHLAIDEDILRRPIHLLSLYPIPGGESGKAAAPWGIDLGHHQLALEEHQALRIKQICRKEGIPFWEWRPMNAQFVLARPYAFRDQFDEICETFGVPVPPVTEE